ncbi:MAG: apolipoprotein N-acyltransferase, partial [Rhodospirillales bacterium]|nr:apolipoprotein N-acyltransferase [Rhodospirillales bacterium]
DALAQPAAWVGSYGLSALTVALLGLPAALTAVPRIGLGLAALALAAPFAAGALRLAPSTQASPAVSLRLVQPNVPQGEKWRRELRDRHFEQLMRLSTLERPAATKVVIWPETATPFVFAESPDYRRMAARIVPPGGYLLLGAPRGAMTPAETAVAPPGGQRPIWNSLHAVDGGGAILATYDKIHLVPLGEYLPLRRWFPILADTIGRGSFEAGAERRTIRLPGLPAMAVVICYEVIFPGAVVDGADRPGWILNVTNDSWFGESSGPHQHLVSARMRSIEEGLPQIRVANTGISAVIDPYGRIEARLGMNKTGVIDHELPAALPPTFYARWSDWTFLALLVGMLGIAGWGAGPRRR